MLQEVQGLSLEVLIDGVYPENGEEIDRNSLCRVGSELSRGKALFLEKLLSTKPNSYPIHAMLFGFYAHAVGGNEATATAEDKAAFKRELIWLIANRPDSFILFGSDESLMSENDPELNQQAKQLWLHHLEATVPHEGILQNAFEFFYLDCRDLELAERVAAKGQSLSPGDGDWATKLQMLYCERIAMSDGPEKQEWAAKAVEQLQLYRRRMVVAEGDTVVFRLGHAALIAGKVEQAQECAQELLGLQIDENDEYISQAHVLSGLISLQQGDVSAARQSLAQAAAAYKGGGYLPLALADELWFKGQTEAVLGFLRAGAAKCRTSHYLHDITGLINEIESGKAPRWPYEWDNA